MKKVIFLLLIISITIQKKNHKRNLDDEQGDSKSIDLKKNANRKYLEELTVALKSFRKKQIEIHSSFERTFENMLKKVERENKKILMKTLQNGGFIYTSKIKNEKKMFKKINNIFDKSKDFDHTVEYNWTDLESKIGLADPQKIDPQYNEIIDAL